MALRLCLIVCLVAPPASWVSVDSTGADQGCSAVNTPSGAQLVREAAKTEKPAATPWLAMLELPVTHVPAFVTNFSTINPQAASHVTLDAPPLAPRPPPL